MTTSEYESIVRCGIERALQVKPFLEHTKGINVLASEARALIQAHEYYFSHRSHVSIGSRRQTVADYLCDDPKALRDIVQVLSSSVDEGAHDYELDRC